MTNSDSHDCKILGASGQSSACMQTAAQQCMVLSRGQCITKGAKSVKNIAFSVQVYTYKISAQCCVCRKWYLSGCFCLASFGASLGQLQGLLHLLHCKPIHLCKIDNRKMSALLTSSSAKAFWHANGKSRWADAELCCKCEQHSKLSELITGSAVTLP